MTMNINEMMKAVKEFKKTEITAQMYALRVLFRNAGIRMKHSDGDCPLIFNNTENPLYLDCDQFRLSSHHVIKFEMVPTADDLASTTVKVTLPSWIVERIKYERQYRGDKYNIIAMSDEGVTDATRHIEDAMYEWREFDANMTFVDDDTITFDCDTLLTRDNNFNLLVESIQRFSKAIDDQEYLGVSMKREDGSETTHIDELKMMFNGDKDFIDFVFGKTIENDLKCDSHPSGVYCELSLHDTAMEDHGRNFGVACEVIVFNDEGEQKYRFDPILSKCRIWHNFEEGVTYTNDDGSISSKESFEAQFGGGFVFEDNNGYPQWVKYNK